MRKFLPVLLLAALILSACDDIAPAPQAYTVEVAYSPALAAWMDSAITAFNESEVAFSEEDSRVIRVEGRAIEAGAFVAEMQSAGLPALWIPESDYWIDILNSRIDSTVYGPDTCESVAASPLVFAIWRPVAEALGWPASSLGWIDLASLGLDPSFWRYYSGGQWGEAFQLGHTHPGLSDSGLQTLLALVYAAQNAPDSLSPEMVEQPVVASSVGTFEGAVSWFSSDTLSLIRGMVERGPSYLSAAVVYEANVIQANRGAYGEPEAPLVAVYPFEGTFVARFPACTSGQVGADSQSAAGIFREYLLSAAGQELARASGLRPAAPDADLSGSAINEANGADPNQPQKVAAHPTLATIDAVQALWREQRKDVNLVLVIDISGSMQGTKIAEVRRSAQAFIEQMGEDDILGVVLFNDRIGTIGEAGPIGPNRDTVINAIRGIEAGGGTAFYDALAAGAGLLEQNASPDRVSAIVALTDGIDENSQHFALSSGLYDVLKEGDPTLVMIAYGADADTGALSTIAQETGGLFYRGSVAEIADIYAEMSAAFGGAVGIGR